MTILKASFLAIAAGLLAVVVSLGLAVASGNAVIDSNIKVGQASMIGLKPVNANGAGYHLKASSIFSQELWLSGEVATITHCHAIIGGGVAANVSNPRIRGRFYLLVEVRGKLMGIVAASGLRKGASVSSTTGSG